MTHKFILGGLLAVFLVGLSAPVTAQEKKMTRDEFKALMAEYTGRDSTAQVQIAALDTDIAALQAQLEGLNSDIAAINAATLQMVGATAAQSAAFGRELDALTAQLEGLLSLAPEELFKQRGELEALAARLAELQQSKLAALPEHAAKLDRLEGLVKDLDGRRPRQLTLKYEVMRGDNLWNISKKDAIYGNPYMWPRIYRANRDQIKDPDMIYPKQSLAVPFGVGENQYLVNQGDFLSSIAAAVYNDPTKWHKIYQANKEKIMEPSMVYPAQVLEIPSN